MAVARQAPYHCFFGTISVAAVVFLAAANGLPESKAITYVVRVAQETSINSTCVLLEDTGAFHFESGDRLQTKVLEGELSAAQLEALRQNLGKFYDLSQAEIEEPLIHGPRNLVDIHIFRKEGTKELLFRSAESQQAYAADLNPLLRWMYGLRKLPHRELSEDAGKRNCLPRKSLVLKSREENPPPAAPVRTPLAGRRIAPPAGRVAPSDPLVQPLVRLKLMQKTSSDARQTCALVAEDGRYRFERRRQKNESKKVDNLVAVGRLTTDDLNQLRSILASPALVGIRHREPPDGMPLNIKGAVLELSINRASGVQDLILTDSTRRSTFFYSGDADITSAVPLLGLIRKQIEPRAVPPGKASELNDCSQLP
ncbi:MAG TPA: hypothetical protein VN708_07920 [Terriglobales bacterium]|jgi:hypothetical protein|nr:hypothetical protein [Terriglobales bacterium]